MDWGLHHPLWELSADFPADYLAVKSFLLTPFPYHHPFTTSFKLSTKYPHPLGMPSLLQDHTNTLSLIFSIPRFRSWIDLRIK